MLRIAVFVCLLGVSNIASALTAITIHANAIEHDNTIIKNAILAVDLSAQSSLNLIAHVKQKTDQHWLKAKLDCDIPQNMTKDTWTCHEGLVKSERLKFPFVIDFTPQDQGFSADLKVQEASFNDEAGLHAAEKLSCRMHFNFAQEADHWRWQQELFWTSGEIFWQPFYFADGGYQWSASGILKDGMLNIEHAVFNMKEVGQLNFNAQIRLKDHVLIQFEGDLPNLNLAAAYPLLFKPLLEKTAFSNVEVKGDASLKVSVRDTEMKTFDLRLNNVDVSDKTNKFAFYKLNAELPWNYDEVKKVNIHYESGHLLNLPLGKTNINAEVNRYALTAPNITLPILDGALDLSDISAAWVEGKWHWHLGANLTPVSMPKFSLAMHLPMMQGQASAVIPQVTYSNGVLTTDGEIAFKVFSGQATLTHLVMQNPLGSLPKLNADIRLLHLDLGDLTRTFSFGAIEGKLDGDLAHLQMQNWKPVSFDAKFQSSSGKYPKKISQRAVENISALGGAGAAAAIQRSFMRFFEQFNYEKIAISCKLRNDICQMGGIESTTGGYIIVKGSGIPAITVMGYNQSVGWSELLARIKRVTDRNSQAIVR